ncbi:hypothetical protein D7Y41_34445 [Anaerotruncus sp. 1XD22-93]|nr:hypothetical protein D7Y41_34445 [Anaerotruncus sp. 1XD22-93]
MPGPVRADGLFFACAKSKVKSTHKGSTPYVSPGRVPAFGWAEGTRMSVPAPTCFLSRQALSLAPGRAAKPHYTVPDRAGPASLPACSGAVQKCAPLSQNRTLDSALFSGYNEHKERRCPQTVSPLL